MKNESSHTLQRSVIEVNSLYVTDASVPAEGSTNISRADPPWMTQPISSSPPPPWEPPAGSWDGLGINTSNLNAAEWPADTSEFNREPLFKDKSLQHFA